MCVCVCVFKEDLVLNNLRVLIYHSSKYLTLPSTPLD